MRRTKLAYVTGAVVAAVVIVVAAASYLRAGQNGQQGEEATRQSAGAQVFRDKSCIQCHYPDSTEQKVGPGLENILQRDQLPASGRPATRENVREQLFDPYQNMPSYEGRLTDEETEQLLDYQETL